MHNSNENGLPLRSGPPKSKLHPLPAFSCSKKWVPSSPPGGRVKNFHVFVLICICCPHLSLSVFTHIVSLCTDVFELKSLSTCCSLSPWHLPQPNHFQGDRKEQKIQLECPFYVLPGYFNLKKKKLFIVSMSMFYIGSDNVKVHRAMGKVPGH